MFRALPCLLLLSVILFAPSFSHAQDADTGNAPVETEYLEKAQVINATPSVETTVPDTGVSEEVQTLTVKVLSGPDMGTTTTFENDFTQLKAGSLFYVRHTSGGDAPDMWSVSDPYRLNVLIALAAMFLVLVFVFGGLQGIRGLISLGGSLVLIFSILLPGIYAGYSPVFLAVGVSGLIIVIGSYITHGVNRTTSAAVLGMLATVIVTGIGAYWAVHAAQLSGFTSENNVYLNFNTNGAIDMVGLLFGGIMIGLLGVLYDIAIGQAVAIEELFDAGRHLSRIEVYRKGIRIGREHIGALINTLAIAYVGVSLPLLLLFKSSNTGPIYIINSELFATEIVRILIGGIGLVLAVPITTLIASYMLYGRKRSAPKGEEPHHHH